MAPGADCCAALRSSGVISVGILGHFAEEMTQDGWAISGRFAESQSKLEDPEPALLFIKDGREAYVGLREDQDSHEVTSTVVMYERG